MKKYLLINLLVVFCWSLNAQVPLGTVVGGGITVPDAQTDIPTHYDFLGQGGYRKVATITDRDAIKPSRLSDGMLVFVAQDSTFYQLSVNTWKPVRFGGIKPNGPEGSIQTKSGDQLAGSWLGILDNFIYSLDTTPSDAGFTSNTYMQDDSRIISTMRVNPNSGTVSEITWNNKENTRRYHTHVYAKPSNVELLSENDINGSRLYMDTATITHSTAVFDPVYVFSSSLLDTTFRIYKKIKFEQPGSSIYTKNGDLRLSDQTGDYALIDFLGGTGSVTSVGLSMPGIFSVSGSPVTSSGTLSAALTSQTQNTVFAAPTAANGIPVFRTLTETDIPNLNWTKITNKPTTLNGYNITDAYTKNETQTLVGDTAYILRQLIKGGGSEPIPGDDNTVLVLQGNKASSFANAKLTNQGNFSLLSFRNSNTSYLRSNGSSMELFGKAAGNYPYGFFTVNPDIGVETRYETSGISSYSIATGVSWIAHCASKGTPAGYQILLQSGDFTIRQNTSQIGEYLPNLVYKDNNLQIRNSMVLRSNDFTNSIVTLSTTSDNDFSLSSAKAGATTLTQLMQKGQIIQSGTEPDIPNDSFAFWVNGSDFYLILDSGGVQKKLQLQ